ncbi:helix-turn-helix domain-containing protein [Streptomyces sp. SHP 1-2]|uniref:helix-turn-helix domain-containing protein n=1 Tax=Streptomyces sp. SHP 1-2 TaxID=2769489 RepID=UPI0022376BA5|nr:helix-turn-helix domain-containing protein [Streptomyces sp. SHP 1-2]MCW5251438.1 helix-turn-helix domain-containing protein [Streptomyces sp. SHP 1-2]
MPSPEEHPSGPLGPGPVPGDHEVEALRRIAATVNSNLELSAVLDAIVSAVSAFTEWQLCWVTALDVPAGVAEVIAREDRLTYSGDSQQRIWPIEGIPARDLIGGTGPIVVDDAQQSPYRFYADDARRRGYRCGVLLPLREPYLDGRPLVLAVQRRTAGQVGDRALAFLEAVADLSSVALANAGKVADEQRNIAELVRATATLRTGLAATLEGRDGEEILAAVADTLDVAIVVAHHNLAPMFVTAGQSWPPPGKGAADYAALARDEIRRQQGTRGHGASPDVPPPVRVKVTELLPGSERRLWACVLRRGAVTRVETALDSLVNVAVGIVVGRSLLATAAQDKETDTALAELVRRSPSDPLALRVRLAALGLPPPVRCRVVRISARSPVDTDLRRVLSDVHSVLRSRRVSGVVVGWVDSSVVMVLPDTGDDHREAVAAIRGMLHGVAGIGTALTVAMSAPGEVPADGARMWAECETLTLAGVAGGGDVIAYEGFGALAFLLSACRDGEANRFVEARLGELRRYDTEHSGSLVGTLEVFLQCSARFQETARALCVHVSTLRYRLDRITEVLGVDLKDPDERFSLALACRLMRMVEASGTPGGKHL